MTVVPSEIMAMMRLCCTVDGVLFRNDDLYTRSCILCEADDTTTEILRTQLFEVHNESIPCMATPVMACGIPNCVSFQHVARSADRMVQPWVILRWEQQGVCAVYWLTPEEPLRLNDEDIS